MSLFGSLFTGVSGLNAQSSAITTIANNIANVNTTAYKSDQTSFSSLVSGNGGSGAVQATNRATVSSQGTLETSSSDTDLAISGNGFFVVKTDHTPLAEVRFTRAGSFTQDSDGYLKNAAGNFLYGWKLDSSGSVPSSSADVNSLEPINVSYLGGQTKETTTSTLSINLNSSTAAAGTFARDITVYDSLGTAQTVSMTFTKASANNKWTVEMTDSAGTNLLPLNTDHSPSDHAADVTFNSDGSLASVSSSGVVSTSGTLVANGSGGAGITWPSGGASQSASQTITFDLASMTQYDSANNVVSITQNGASLGTRTGISVDSKGIVSATFSNGTTAKIYQVALATFNNPDGLKLESGNAYTASQASGDYNLRKAGESGAGSVSSKSLEESNVDLATEYSKMIVVQRAYSASSKVITTVDKMLEELGNIVR